MNAKKKVDKSDKVLNNSIKSDVESDNQQKPEAVIQSAPRKRESREETLRRKRETRVPLTGGDKLHVPSEIQAKYAKEGYKLEIFNDEGSRLDEAQQAGWEFVKGDVPTRDRAVGDGEQIGENVSRPVGGGITGYLMFIEEELVQEDAKKEQDRVDESEKAIRRTQQLESDMAKDGAGGQAYGEIKQTVR